MKRLLLLLCVGFILNACTKESLSGTTDTLRETPITFGLKMPHTTPATTRTTDVAKDVKLNEINLLVFDSKSKNFLYGRKGIKPYTTTGNSAEFTAKLLMTNTAVTIHLLANPTAEADPASFIGKTESDLNAIITSLELNAATTTALPMHGTLELPKIDLTTNVEEAVSLTRAVARVDVLVHEAVTNFTLQKITAYYTPDRGYWVDRKTTHPTIPTIGVNLITPASPVVTDLKAIENQLFIYEKPYSNTLGEGTRIVVQGKYTDKDNVITTSYYPIDFTKTETNGTVTPLDVLRNDLYRFIINSVSGLGYATEEEASKGTAANIQISLIPWNSSDMGDIIFDGSNHFSIERKTLSLAGEKDYEDYLKVASSIDASKWEMKWGDAPAWSPLSELSSTNFKVTKPASGTSGSLKFITLNEITNPDVVHKEELHIKVADRLQLTVTITQKLDAVGVFLTVNGEVGTLLTPYENLIYHENHYSDKFIVSTGDNLALWNAFPQDNYDFLSFQTGGINNGFFRTKFTPTTSREARTGIIRVERGIGTVDPVYVKVTHEGAPLFNTIGFPEIEVGYPKVIQMIPTGMGSHPELYTWTAELTDVKQIIPDVNETLTPQTALILGVSSTPDGAVATPSPNPHFVSGAGGEYLVIAAANSNPDAPNYWSGVLKVRYTRKSTSHPYTISMPENSVASTASYKLGDYVPHGCATVDAEGIIFNKNPIRILTLGFERGSYTDTKSYCAQIGARMISRWDVPIDIASNKAVSASIIAHTIATDGNTEGYLYIGGATGIRKSFFIAQLIELHGKPKLGERDDWCALNLASKNPGGSLNTYINGVSGIVGDAYVMRCIRE